MSSKKAKKVKKKKKVEEKSSPNYVFPAVILGMILMVVAYAWYQPKSEDTPPIDYKKTVYDFESSLTELDQLKDGISQRAAVDPVKAISEYDEKIQNVLKDLEVYLQDDSLKMFYEKHVDLETRFDWYRGTSINDENRRGVESLLNEFFRLDEDIYNYLENEYLKYRREAQSK